MLIPFLLYLLRFSTSCNLQAFTFKKPLAEGLRISQSLVEQEGFEPPCAAYRFSKLLKHSTLLTHSGYLLASANFATVPINKRLAELYTVMASLLNVTLYANF